MELSPSWETVSCSATRDFSNILRDPKIHYCVQKSTSLVLILSQINPVHTTPSHLYPRTILISTHLRRGLPSGLSPSGHPMELSPYSEAANCSVTQEFTSILRNPEIHYRIHKIPPLVPILRQITPLHTTSSYLSNIYFNMILPMSTPSQWSLSFRIYNQKPIYIPFLPPYVLRALPISSSLTSSF
jgi:hypothetical protein